MNTNLEWMFIGKKDTAAYSTTSPIKQSSDLRVGELALVNLAGERVSTVNTAALKAGLRVVQNDGGVLRYSPIIDNTNLLSVTNKDYLPFLRQVSFVGWNGTSGDIFVDNNTNYSINVRFKENNPNQYDVAPVLSGYTSDSNATAAEIADNQLASLTLNTNDAKKRPVKVSRVGNHNSVIELFGGTATAVKLNKGSKVVEFVKHNTSTGAVEAATGDVTVGRYVSFPSDTGNKFTINGTGTAITYIGTTAYSATSAAGLTTAINAGTQAIAGVNGNTVTIIYTNQNETCPPIKVTTATDVNLPATLVSGFGESEPVVYKAATGGTGVASFMLDVAWQGETCYVACAVSGTTTKGAYAGFTGNGSTYADPTAWGVKLQATNKNYSANRIIRETVAFSVEAIGYGSTPITHTVFPNIGNGDWGLVTDRYIFAQAEGKNASQYQNDRYSTINFADQYEVYDLWTLEVAGGQTSGTGIQYNSKVEANIILALPAVGYHTDSGDANKLIDDKLTTLATLL